jgi:hypothetical protein
MRSGTEELSFAQGVEREADIISVTQPDGRFWEPTSTW